jgi:hypothetical protein
VRELNSETSFNLTSERIIATWEHNNGGGRSRAIVVIWDISASAEKERSSYSYKNEHFVLICRCILIIVSAMFTTSRQAISCHAAVYHKFTLVGKLTHRIVMAVIKTSILKLFSSN